LAILSSLQALCAHGPNGLAQRQGGTGKTLQSLSRNFLKIAPHTFRAQPCPLELVLARFESIRRQPDFLQILSCTQLIEIKPFHCKPYKRRLRRPTDLVLSYASKFQLRQRATSGKMAGKNCLPKKAITSGGLTKPSLTWRVKAKAIQADCLPACTTKTPPIVKVRPLVFY
jgi:hypothetical protein